jgi:hypothetical protein
VDVTHSRAWLRAARALGAVVATLLVSLAAEALPNTHAPAISTWDPRASSVVFGLGRAMSGDGSFTFTSYNANFSSTNGVLSAQFGAHYITFVDTEGGPTARGASASGVALISLPLASRFDNGVPRSAFAFYVGGVPTAMFSGQLNYISVPLVLGVGIPLSPSRYLTFRPWVELSPGLNFDTHIQGVSTDEAIQAAMDGTLTQEEVEDLVEEGLDIQRETTVGKRAGLSIAAHLGERVDFDVNLMLGAGHPGALSLGAGLVVRWDALVHELGRERDRTDGERAGDGETDAAAARESCAALAVRYHRTCRLRRPATAPARAAPPKAPHARTSPVRPKTTRSKKPAPSAPVQPVRPAPVPPPQRGQPGELPPLQAAPPRTP